MKTADIVAMLQKTNEAKNELYKAFNVTVLRESVEEIAATRLTDIVHTAESCKTSIANRLQTVDENAEYSVSFNDGEQRTARKVAEEAKWFYDQIKPLLDLIMEGNDNAPG